MSNAKAAGQISRALDRTSLDFIQVAFHLGYQDPAIQTNLMELFIQMIQTWEEHYRHGVVTDYTQFAHRIYSSVIGESE